jgi:uncharacterized FlgJ-related protein
MFFVYDRKAVLYRKVGWGQPLLILAATAFISALSAFGFGYGERVYEGIVNVYLHEPKFSEERLVAKLKELNVKYPHIALAQARVESANYTSTIFKENNNLFGMKQARIRINLAKGTNRSHAYYASWEDSVLDYAFWCATYANKCRNEDDFFNLLSSYAEADYYESALRKAIENNDLKSKFK